MSLPKFWMNVRHALRRADRGEPRFPATEDLDGYRPDDFAFLPEDERRTIDEAVARIRDVAVYSPFDPDPTPDQAAAAREAFGRIAAVFRTDRFADADAFRLGTRLETRLDERGLLPNWVRGFTEYSTDYDSAGDPALWLRATVDDAAAKKPVRLDNFWGLQKLLQKVMGEVEPGRELHLRFQTVSTARDYAREDAKAA